MAGLEVFGQILSILGFIVRFVGFLIIGFGIGRFVLDNYKTSEWQVRIALALGYFGLLVGITDFASPGSTGAFALGSGVAFFMANMPKKTENEEEKSG